MKQCPECKRTYADDSITFCLADGTLLSAPFDPLEHPIRRVEPPPTELMAHAAVPSDKSSEPTSKQAPSPFPTITAQAPMFSGPGSVGPNTSSSTKRIRLIYLIVPSALIICLFGFLLYLLRPTGSCPRLSIDCFPSTGSTNCQVLIYEKTHSGTIAADSNLVCSLSPMLALQAGSPSIPHAVTEINWTVSSGTIDSQGKRNSGIQIDTTGLVGRQVTVTAAVSGYGLFCPNATSATFTAK